MVFVSSVIILFPAYFLYKPTTSMMSGCPTRRSVWDADYISFMMTHHDSLTTKQMIVHEFNLWFGASVFMPLTESQAQYIINHYAKYVIASVPKTIASDI